MTTRYKPAIKNGTEWIFRLNDISPHEFVACDPETYQGINLRELDGLKCEVVAFATSTAGPGDVSDPEFEYYDLRFPNGLNLEAVSDYHLEEIP